MGQSIVPNQARYQLRYTRIECLLIIANRNGLVKNNPPSCGKIVDKRLYNSYNTVKAMMGRSTSQRMRREDAVW